MNKDINTQQGKNIKVVIDMYNDWRRDYEVKPDREGLLSFSEMIEKINDDFIVIKRIKLNE